MAAMAAEAMAAVTIRREVVTHDDLSFARNVLRLMSRGEFDVLIISRRVRLARQAVAVTFTRRHDRPPSRGSSINTFTRVGAIFTALRIRQFAIELFRQDANSGMGIAYLIVAAS
jgi:hypothetical protein